MKETEVGELDARRVLLVRAFEEEDRDGLVLAPAERRQAARDVVLRGSPEAPEATAARPPQSAADPVAGLVARARALHALIMERSRSAQDVFALAGAGRLLALVSAPVAFLCGLLAQQLGADRRVNILSVPLLGILAWNVAVYALLPFVARVRIRRPAVPGFLARLVAWFAAPDRFWVHRTADGAERRAVTAALRKFVSDWLRVGAPLHVARATLALHLGALLLAAGAVSGMYLRGIAFQYQATWESTFLGPRELHSLMRIVLAPAIALTGQGIPSPAELDQMRQTPGDAAPWIHLYAVTMALVVGVPRLLLAAATAFRVARLTRSFPLRLDEDPAFLRLLAGERGEGVRVTVIPYSVKLPPGGSGILLSFLGDLLGARARVDIQDPLTYGDDPLPLSGEGPSLRVVLFNLAQPPEEEVHGRFLEALSEPRAPGSDRVLVLVDESAMRRTLGGGAAGAERISQRTKAWRAALEDAGLPVVPVDLSRPVGDGGMESARAALRARPRGRSRS